MNNLITSIAVVFVMCAGLVSAQSNDTTRFLTFSGSEDNQTAAASICAALKKNGYKVLKNTGESQAVLYINEKLLVSFEVRMKSEGIPLSRIIFNKYWVVEFKYKNSDVLKELVWNANRQLVIGTYYIDSDGDLQIRGELAFLDTLDLDLLTAYAKWFTVGSLTALEIIDKNYLDYFK